MRNGLPSWLRHVLLVSAYSAGISLHVGAQSSPAQSSDEYDLYAPDEQAVRRAKDGLVFAAREFRRYMGERPPKIAVVLLDGRGEPTTPDGDLPVLYWFTGEGLAQARSHGGSAAPADTARDRAFAESALPHEACHWYLSTYIGSRASAEPRAGAAQRSSAHVSAPGVPAWYNEGFGTLCEPAAWQEKRHQQMVRGRDAAISFAKFLSMPHPKAVSSLPATALPRTAEERIALMKQGDDAGALLFYAQAHSLLRFLAEREGPEFVGLVGRGLAAGESLPQLLRRGRRLPHDPVALEQAWRSWLGDKVNGQ